MESPLDTYKRAAMEAAARYAEVDAQAMVTKGVAARDMRRAAWREREDRIAEARRRYAATLKPRRKGLS